MELREAAAALGLDAQRQEALAPGWETSMDSLPDNLPSILDLDQLTAARAFCGIGAEVDAALRDAVAAIAASPPLAALLWHCHRHLYQDTAVERFSEWPAAVAPLGERTGMLYLIVALAGVPLVRGKFRSLNVPEAVARDTCAAIGAWVDTHRAAHGGLPGASNVALHWLRHYVQGRIFRLGRMEYLIQALTDFGVVFRHKGSGRDLAFAKAGVKFNGAGFVDGAGGRFDAERGWESSFAMDELAATGNPISPYGMADRQPLTLSRGEWDIVLQEGDQVIDMHIPAGGGMTPRACLESMTKAWEFFGAQFPEKRPKAIVCKSWIFNTQFEEWLPDSNLAKFMRELYLFPVKSSGRDGMYFVFQRDYEDLSQAPRDTSLRRCMLDILGSGQPLRAGGMFIFREDLERFGSSFHRAHAQR